MRAVCLPIHSSALVYSTTYHHGSGLATMGEGVHVPPHCRVGGPEPTCASGDDGHDVTYKGSPVANLCDRISSFSLSLLVWWFLSSPSSEHCGILAS